MKISWNSHDLLKSSSLAAEAGEYDGMPRLPRLDLNWVPYQVVPPQRVAVAAALVFRDSLSGQLKVPSAVMPLLANAIANICLPTLVSVSPVTYAANIVEQGTVVLAINRGGNDCVDTRFQGFDIPRVVDLTVLDSGSVAGVQFEPLSNLVRVPSNAWLHTRGVDTSVAYFFPYIAVAVLMAHDLDAGTIRLPPCVRRDAQYDKVAELLRAVGLLIEIDPGAERA
jgi:hypothetical protein